jgi:hypothetical protein
MVLQDNISDDLSAKNMRHPFFLKVGAFTSDDRYITHECMSSDSVGFTSSV